MSRIRDLVLGAELRRTEAPDGDGLETTMGFTYAVCQKIPASHIMLNADREDVFAYNERVLRHELMYALAGDIAGKLTLLRLHARLLLAYMEPRLESDEALEKILKEIGDIIKELEI